MNTKVYEKTRYQNIYRHKKNKNYLIMISKPVKTSISSIDENKIMRLEDAIKIRDNPKIRYSKGIETLNKDDFDTMWDKYIKYCKSELKLAYNSLVRKDRTYSKYLKDKFKKKITKITKQEIILFISKQNCSDKQKNQILKELKAFFNWCLKEEYIFSSPVVNIKKYKVDKTEFKFWTPEEFSQFISYLNFCIETNNGKKYAYMIKILALIGFNLGDRIGETRALTYNCFDVDNEIVKIHHSINYDTNDTNFFSTTKTESSHRDINTTKKLINEIYLYKDYLINDLGYSINDNDLIFLNQSTKKPYSDSFLRSKFYYYCDEAKVPRIKMYNLRHTYVATMMAEGKELYHISKRLGHTNYSITVNKYGQLSDVIKKEIAQTTDKYY